MPVLWLVASLNWDFSGRAVDHHEFNIIVHILGFPAGSDVKKSACNAGDPGSIPGLGRSPEEGWQPTPVFLPRESHGRRRLEGHSPWGHKESDTFTCYELW